MLLEILRSDIPNESHFNLETEDANSDPEDTPDHSFSEHCIIHFILSSW